ncbi:MAG: sigma-70 family RNA polymerase sigma factor [Caldilineales bacterium]|nr:sigma-70 family RNA polymerase sigma factor [Caldilineales bacterium]
MKSNRSNSDWLHELKGAAGVQTQRQAHEDLANYLYVVAYNYLRLRQTDIAALDRFAEEEKAALAQDFVQETLEKLAADDFALLQNYRGDGRFLSWAASVVRNQAAQELRRSYWTRRIAGSVDGEEESPLPLLTLPDLTPASNPADSLEQRELASALQDCIEALPERSRLAFWWTVAEDIPAASVADHFETTANAIYLLVSRARRQLRECLQAREVTPFALAA